MAGRGEEVAAAAVEHAARTVEQRERRRVAATAVATVATAASISVLGLVGIPITLTAFVLTGRMLGRRRRARDVARAASAGDRSWTLVGNRVVGRTDAGRELALVLPAPLVRSLRALPAARVVARPQASSTPPATER